MKLGIVGLPNVGKSTLFNAITNVGAEVANYPFATIEPNVGIVEVKDKRIDALGKLSNTQRYIYATVEFCDIAGLVRGASKGEGLGNQFLSHIREVEAIVHVVRCFDNGEIIHVDGSVDPVRDIETINLELVFADLELLEKRFARIDKQAKADKKLAFERDTVEKIINVLQEDLPARSAELTPEEQDVIKNYNLLTMKPVIYVANVAEEDVSNPDIEYVKAVEAYAAKSGDEVVPISAAIEEEIASLDDESKSIFLEELGLHESGLDRLVKSSYHLLGLISYFTTGEKETRAWTIVNGTKAPEAASKIHTDIQRGFIRAETIAYDDLIAAGSMAHAREQGLIRSEGKDYVVKDGDVINFKFNV